MCEQHVIPILGRDYVIKYVDASEFEDKKGNDNNDIYGEFHHATGEIWIRNGLSANDIRETLVHETCHGIIKESGLGEILDGYNENLEEAIVVAFDHGLNRSGLIRNMLPPPEDEHE